MLPAGYQMLAHRHPSPLQVNGNGQADPQRWEVMNGNQIQWQAQRDTTDLRGLQPYDGEDGNAFTLYKWQCEPGTNTASRWPTTR